MKYLLKKDRETDIIYSTCASGQNLCLHRTLADATENRADEMKQKIQKNVDKVKKRKAVSVQAIHKKRGLDSCER